MANKTRVLYRYCRASSYSNPTINSLTQQSAGVWHPSEGMDPGVLHYMAYQEHFQSIQNLHPEK